MDDFHPKRAYKARAYNDKCVYMVSSTLAMLFFLSPDFPFVSRAAASSLLGPCPKREKKKEKSGQYRGPQQNSVMKGF